MIGTFGGDVSGGRCALETLMSATNMAIDEHNLVAIIILPKRLPKLASYTGAPPLALDQCLGFASPGVLQLSLEISILVHHVGRMRWQLPADCLEAALLGLGWAGALRRSELACVVPCGCASFTALPAAVAV